MAKSVSSLERSADDVSDRLRVGSGRHRHGLLRAGETVINGSQDQRTPTEMSLKAENPQSDKRYQQCANRYCRLRHPVRLLYYLNGRRRFHRIG